MSPRRMEQKAARDVQQATGCPYSVALMYAQREDVQAEARADPRNRPFREKLADAVLKRITPRERV